MQWKGSLCQPLRQFTNRFFIFAIVGPLVGLSALALKVGTLALVAFDAASTKTGSVATVGDARLAALILAAAYATALFPALVTAAADRHFEASPHRKQCAATIGGLSSFLLIVALFRGRIDVFAIMFGACGLAGLPVLGYTRSSTGTLMK